jgi:hypothetical protein
MWKTMRWFVAVASLVALIPASADAADAPYWGDPGTRTPLYLRAEADGTALIGFLPPPMLGGQVAIVAGRPFVHVRVGVGASAGPTFPLGPYGRVGALAEVADLRLCAAAHQRRHRFRLCGGSVAGVMHLRWSGFDVDGRREMPLLHAVLGGDYAVAVADFIDLHAGIDLTVPIVGADLSATHPDGRDTVRTGSVATAFRLGIGFRLH